jgi:hypothetical protein
MRTIQPTLFPLRNARTRLNERDRELYTLRASVLHCEELGAQIQDEMDRGDRGEWALSEGDWDALCEMRDEAERLAQMALMVIRPHLSTWWLD